MPKIFDTLDKIRPAYDFTYKVFMVICKILLIVDILITSYAVCGRYIPFINDPAWSEEVVLTCMSYMAVLSAALAIRREAHIRMTALDRYIPTRVLQILDILADIAVLVLGIIMLPLAGATPPPWAAAVSTFPCPGCPVSGCTSPCLWLVWL